jgi:hypothetical protein
MTTIYSAAKICPFEKQQCNLTTEGLSLDPGELKHDAVATVFEVISFPNSEL